MSGRCMPAMSTELQKARTMMQPCSDIYDVGWSGWLLQAGAVGRFGKLRRGAGHGDHGASGLGEGSDDPTPKSPARANDDRGPARQVTHNVLPLRLPAYGPLPVVLLVEAPQR
jgi:hypothetical protein